MLKETKGSFEKIITNNTKSRTVIIISCLFAVALMIFQITKLIFILLTIILLAYTIMNCIKVFIQYKSVLSRDISPYICVLIFNLALNVSSLRFVFSTESSIPLFLENSGIGTIIVSGVSFLYLLVICFSLFISRGIKRMTNVCTSFIMDSLPGRLFEIDFNEAEKEEKTRESYIRTDFLGTINGIAGLTSVATIFNVLLTIIPTVIISIINVTAYEKSPETFIRVNLTSTFVSGLVFMVPILLLYLSLWKMITITSDVKVDNKKLTEL